MKLEMFRFEGFWWFTMHCGCQQTNMRTMMEANEAPGQVAERLALLNLGCLVIWRDGQ